MKKRSKKIVVALMGIVLSTSIMTSNIFANPLYGKGVSASSSDFVDGASASKKIVRKSPSKPRNKSVSKKATVKSPAIGMGEDSILLKPGDDILWLNTVSKEGNLSRVSYNGNEYLVHSDKIVPPFNMEEAEKYLEKANALNIKSFTPTPVPEKDKGFMQSFDVVSLADMQSDRDILKDITKDFKTDGATPEKRFEDVVKYIKSKNLRYKEDLDEPNQVKTIKDGFTMCLGISRLQAYLYDMCDIEYRFVWTVACNLNDEADDYVLAYNRPSHIYLETKLNGKWCKTDLVGMLPQEEEDMTVNEMQPDDVEFYENFNGLTEKDPIIPMGTTETDEDFPSIYYQISPTVINGEYQGKEITVCKYKNASIEDYLKTLKNYNVSAFWK